MNGNQRIRVVKRGERASLVGATAAEKAPTERELKRTVAGWVSEHRQRSEELRRGLAKMFALEPRPQTF
jgi:hypothetical protein